MPYYKYFDADFGMKRDSLGRPVEFIGHAGQTVCMWYTDEGYLRFGKPLLARQNIYSEPIDNRLEPKYIENLGIQSDIPTFEETQNARHI